MGDTGIRIRLGKDGMGREQGPEGMGIGLG